MKQELLNKLSTWLVTRNSVMIKEEEMFIYGDIETSRDFFI